MNVLNEYPIQVTAQVKDSSEMFDLVMNVIKNLDPSDYIHFLENGELMTRKLEHPKTETRQMYSSNKWLTIVFICLFLLLAESSHKNKVCPACQKKVNEM